MKKFILSALMCVMALSMSAQYVNLGLPSGTKWKTSNEQGYYSFEEAVSTFGKNLPADWQFQELIDYCKWERTDERCKVIGPNGNYIYIPITGFYFEGEGYVENYIGNYWSSTPKGEKYAYWLSIWGNSPYLRDDVERRIFKLPVRLVQ